MTSLADLNLTLMVVEDHELARYGLCMALEDKCGLKTLLEAEDGQQAVRMAQEKNPQVILMDIGLPVLDGISATKEIKRLAPDIKVIMLTSHKDEEEIFAALAAGADAYCLKDIKIERLSQVIEMVLDGALFIDPTIAKTILKALPGAPNTHDANEQGSQPQRRRYNTDLTDREMEVLQLIVGGKSNKEIALALEVTVHTAKAHVCNIIQKLAVDDRTQVAVKALQEGLLEKSSQ